MERRLAAILAADVVGYSRLMGQDEAATLAALKAHRAELIDPKANQYNGRTIKLMGDGSLMEFPSVVEAVAFAVEVQLAMSARNSDLPEDRQIHYRIGINIGDIIVEGDDIYGDGVNIAARLESLAEAGGICVRRNVRNQVRDKLDLDYEDRGEIKVKNIARPIRVFSVVLDDKAEALATPVVTAPIATGRRRWPAIAAVLVLGLVAAGGLAWWQPWAPDVEPASLERMAFPLPEKPSIAVLPFDNLSGDPEQEYFADGITNDIITDLSRFGDLVVIAAQSTFIYKGKPVKVQQVAEELGVRYVVEGSVQKAGNQVRINAQFIDAITGEHLWAERYVRDLSDVFAVQDEITQKIVSTLGTWSGRVAEETLERARQKGTNDLTAYEYFMLGLELGQHFTKEDNTKARELFEKAIERDPRYARAHAALAWTHFFEWQFSWSASEDLSAARAYELAKTAVELDDGEAEAHWILAEVYFLIRKQPEEAIAEFERALALNPNHPEILADWGGYVMPGLTGRADEGIELVKKAMRLNPSHPDWYEKGLGLAAYIARRYDEAISAFRKVEHHTLKSRGIFAASYAQLGRMEEARAEAAKLLELQPEFSIRDWSQKLYFKNPADLEHYLDGLRKAGLPE